MSARPSLLRAAVALAALAAASLSCGREHDQAEGLYAFTAVDVLRDDCGHLSGSKDLARGDVVIAGDVVLIRMHEGLYDARMSGEYLSGVEQFSIDGTVGNLTEPIRGEDCFLDQVSVHLDAATDRPDEFHGTVRIRYLATERDVCTCEVWTTYRAVRL